MPEVTSIHFMVDRPATDWEMGSIREAIKQIMDDKSFFFAGEGELGDEIRRFLVDHPITSNLEFEEDADVGN